MCLCALLVVKGKTGWVRGPGWGRRRGKLRPWERDGTEESVAGRGSHQIRVSRASWKRWSKPKAWNGQGVRGERKGKYEKKLKQTQNPTMAYVIPGEASISKAGLAGSPA